jgi:hypothetical protein
LASRFTLHINFVSHFEDKRQSDGCKNDEGNKDFPHGRVRNLDENYY